MLAIRKHYTEEVIPKLKKQFGYSNVFQVPRLVKIVVNAGLGEAVLSPNVLESMSESFAAITGQRPVLTRARKSIATFKIREGMPIGVSVTLRGERMYSFFERLVHVALPRVRDFRGVSPDAFDGRGNYSLGIREHIVFPEISHDDVDKARSFQVTIVTTASTDQHGYALLSELGMPFKEKTS